MVSIGVDGATGYICRFVAAELVGRGQHVVLVGRDAVGLAQLGGDCEVNLARIDDAEALRRLAKRCTVVVNCAGPFSRLVRRAERLVDGSSVDHRGWRHPSTCVLAEQPRALSAPTTTRKGNHGYSLGDSKAMLMQHAQEQMKASLVSSASSTRQKVALTCRVLFDAGHDAGLAGQITARPSSLERSTPNGSG